MNFPCQDHLTAGLILTIQACSFSCRNVIRWKTESVIRVFSDIFLKGIICRLPEMLLFLFLCNYSLTGSLIICKNIYGINKSNKSFLFLLVWNRCYTSRWKDELMKVFKNMFNINTKVNKNIIHLPFTLYWFFAMTAKLLIFNLI